MKYEIPTCEIVKLDVADVISTSGPDVWGYGELPVGDPENF